MTQIETPALAREEARRSRTPLQSRWSRSLTGLALLAGTAWPTWAVGREPAPEAAIEDAQPFNAKAAADLKFPDGSRWTPELDADSEPTVPDVMGTATPKFRKATRRATYVSRAGETIRAIAYRYCTSPVMVAMASNLPFSPQADEPLKPGTQVTVPVAFRAPSGLHEAEQLVSGPGVESQKNDSNWGRPHFVQQVRALFFDMYKRWPNRHPALVGSLSRMGGGHLGHHKSHRAGQDIDVGYFTYEANRKGWGNPGLGEIDYQRLWYFIDSAEKTGMAAAIYMAPPIQKKLYQYAASQGQPEARLKTLFQYGPKGSRGDTLIRFAPGHRDHFHLRLLCPEDYKDMVGDRNS
jgi:hypothetical protein